MMDNNRLVSVIIPFLNPGSWLVEAVESVLQQTWKNYEIILINDGSVEEDTQVAVQYTKDYPGKILYLQHPGNINKGLTATRNLGIAGAKGSFIAFLDADDCWLPAKLEKQLELFRRFPTIQMVCEASVFWYSWQYPEQVNIIQLIGTKEGIYTPPALMQELYPLGSGQPPCPSGIMITKEALQRSGGFEETFSGVYQLYEDQAFLSKIYSKEIVYISAEANNLYRKRENSMSSAAGDEDIYKKVRLFYADWLGKYLAATQPGNSIIADLTEDFKSSL